MKYLLFSWDEIPEIRDLSYIDNKEFEKLAEKYGVIYDNKDDFEAGFNSEYISTHTHQLRITE